MNVKNIGMAAAVCGVCMVVQSAQAEGTVLSASRGAEAERMIAEEEGGPAFEVAVDFTSRQLTYGLVDNRDPIVTFEALAEWHGFTFEAAMIFDTTKWGRKHGGYGNRQGKYQELAFGPGYGYAFSPDDFNGLPTTVEVFINYIYEYHPRVNKWKGEENPDTQFINVGLALPDLWLSPALSAEFDIDNECGAMYFAAEIGHTFALVSAAEDRETDPLSLSIGSGVGFGNAKRNRYDADFDNCAFKDIWVSASVEWQITDNVVLAPYVAVYEQLHGKLRDAARDYMDEGSHASTQVIGGLRLAASF